ncbi:MAG: XdhC/CoxI family protein [Planctomycetota bacterium]
MREPLNILQTLLSDVQAGRPAALCAVVRTKGSTPQPPGATMLIRHNMTTIGTLGGGCVEAEVRKRAYEHLLRGDRSALLDFVLDHDYGWDDGLICGGRMIFGVNVISDPNDLAPFREALLRADRREPAIFPIVVQQDGESVEYRVHIEVPPKLIIVGAGHVGQAVARLAADLDFHVTVIDDRDDMASPSRFSDRVQLVVGDIARTLREFPLDIGSYVVIVTRGHQHDHKALDAVIRREAAYIGLIGSRRKSRMIFDDLVQANASPDQVARVHTPIGLPIGAITVNEIAVSIIAELVKERRRIAPKLVEGPFGTSDFKSSDA